MTTTKGSMVQWYNSRLGCERSRVRFPVEPINSKYSDRKIRAFFLSFSVFLFFFSFFCCDVVFLLLFLIIFFFLEEDGLIPFQQSYFTSRSLYSSSVDKILRIVYSFNKFFLLSILTITSLLVQHSSLCKSSQAVAICHCRINCFFTLPISASHLLPITVVIDFVVTRASFSFPSLPYML